MKVNKIKNMSKTGAKVLLFLILAVTLGLANNCRSGGDDDKENGMKPGDNMTNADAEVVKQAKDALMIVYAEGDSQTSVTQNISLPTAGENGVAISWESGNSAVVAVPPPPPLDSEPITGTVTRPDDANTEVILTATLTKNEARDTRRFTLAVVPPCTTSEMTAKLKADPPSLSGCSAVSIRGADMPALRSAGVTSTQFLPVWSADQDMGFTPAQLWEASVTIAEMKSHGLTIPQMYNMGQGVPGYTLFNEACNTPQAVGTAPAPRLTTTTLTATDTQVVLTANSIVSARYTSNELLGTGVNITIDTAVREDGRGDVRARYVSYDGVTLVSTLSVPLADVFSNPMVSVKDNQLRITSIQLCPGS